MSGLRGDEALGLADEFEAGFRTSIISFWYPRAIDPEGGYRVGSDARGRPARNVRGIVSQARLLYVFARAARAGHRPDTMMAAAEHGFTYLRDVMWDAEHGGFRWLLTDPRKLTYGNAFAMFALAEYAHAGGPAEAGELAVRTLDVLETHAHDDEHGGYRDFFEPDWSVPVPRAVSPIDSRGPDDKLINTQLHVMEAMVAVHRTDLDPRGATRATELLDVFARRAVRRRYGVALTDAWSPSWQPRRRDRYVRYGHLVELAWLLPDTLDALADVSGDGAVTPELDAEVRTAAARMFDYAVPRGVSTRGGIWKGGPLGKGVSDRHYEGWAQAEGLLGYLGRYRATGDDVHLDGLRRLWAFINAVVVDHVVGEWHDVIDENGTGHGPKGSPWKAGYHSTRALLDGAEILRSLEPPPDPDEDSEDLESEPDRADEGRRGEREGRGLERG